MYNAAKTLEHRIAALGKVEAPEGIRRIRFRQSKALELHNPYPIVGAEINKVFGDKALFEMHLSNSVRSKSGVNWW